MGFTHSGQWGDNLQVGLGGCWWDLLTVVSGVVTFSGQWGGNLQWSVGW